MLLRDRKLERKISNKDAIRRCIGLTEEQHLYLKSYKTKLKISNSCLLSEAIELFKKEEPLTDEEFAEVKSNNVAYRRRLKTRSPQKKDNRIRVRLSQRNSKRIRELAKSNGEYQRVLLKRIILEYSKKDIDITDIRKTKIERSVYLTAAEREIIVSLTKKLNISMIQLINKLIDIWYQETQETQEIKEVQETKYTEKFLDELQYLASDFGM